MKAAILTSSLNVTNGWGRYTVNLVRALTEQGVQCTVFTEDVSRPAGVFVAVERIRSKPGSGIRGVIRLASDILTFRRRARTFDVVHACTETHIFLAWLSGRPYVVSTHGTYMVRFLNHRVIGMIARRAFTAASAVIVTSEHTYKQISSHVRIRRTEQLPNGVDTTVFHRDPLVQRDPHAFITVGAIKPRKGQDIGVLALSILKKRFPDCRYIIVGKTEFGDFRSRLDLLIDEHSLSSSVIFAESPDDTELVRLYNSCAAFALPSRIDDSGSFEGYPLSLLEASACGLPVIGSYGCGAEHLIQNNVNGFLVKSDDQHGLAAALERLFEDPERGERMGQQAEIIASGLSWKKNAIRVIGIYRDVTKSLAPNSR